MTMAMKSISYSYMQSGMMVKSSILFVDLSSENYPRCAFFNERNNRFLSHGHCGQQGFTSAEEVEDMRYEMLGEVGTDILLRIKSLIPEGFFPSPTRYDVDGNPFVHGDRMSKRQYFSHGGPGWDMRFSQPEFNWSTDEVESDEPYPEGTQGTP